MCIKFFTSNGGGGVIVLLEIEKPSAPFIGVMLEKILLFVVIEKTALIASI